ncbi:hypothetical protein INT48_004776 [Thamnidium elegans]|uniref:C3H1-type domain-containing protein n=1 Tax=Thamnidium elegans TaxID=101142 RepID=A0A8H7VVZ8_9FUNG|nr:hypothetical protein INT48_004776 [Thamnidium elegans]
MPNEALKKLFSVRPPTIEEILAKENSRETSDVSTSLTSAVISSKRKIPSVPLIQDTLLPSTFAGQKNHVMHVAKKTKVVLDPKPVLPPSQLQKRKEFENSVTHVEQLPSAAKKLKPSPKFERKIIDPKTGLILSKPTVVKKPVEPTARIVAPSSNSSAVVNTSTTPTRPFEYTPPASLVNASITPTKPFEYTPPAPLVNASITPTKPFEYTPPAPLAVPYTVPTISPRTTSTEPARGPIEPKVFRKRQKKNKIAKMAAKRHQDYPKEKADLDFDTLLRYHEEASKKQNQSKTKNQKAANKASMNSFKPSQPENKAHGPSQAAPESSQQASNKTHGPSQPTNKTPINSQPTNKTPINSQAANKTPISSQAANKTHVPSQAANKTPINPQVANKTPISSQAANKTPISSQAVNVSTVSQQKQRKQDKPKQGSTKQQSQVNEAGTCIPSTKKEAGGSNKTPVNKNNKNQKKFVPTVVCSYFLKGFCKQGDACTFKHEGEPAPPPTLKTVCQFFKTGSCNQGAECLYSHDLKIEPCRFFHLKGTCEQEDRCPYSHEPLTEDGLNRLRALTGPCRFFHFKGYCNTGDACLFSHAEASEEEKKVVESNILACRFFHITKNCKEGDNCFYLHDEASEEQIRKLK